MANENEAHYRRLEQLYHAAPINAYYEPQLAVSAAAAELSIEIRPKMHHAAGALHGSVYFKLLDDAAFFAANSLESKVFLLTASFNVHLIRPVSEGRITAHGRLTERTSRLFFAESKLKDAAGRLIGAGSGTFARSKIVLSEIDL